MTMGNRMKSPYAQADFISICVDRECCINTRLFKEIVDSLTKIIILAQTSKCNSTTILSKMINRLTLCRRAVLNAISSFESFTKNLHSLHSIEESDLNSLANIVTRLIECKNDVSESIDDAIQFECEKELRNSLTLLSSYIDSILIIILALLLAILSRVKVDQEISKKFSSIAASALFSSLTNIYSESVKRALGNCFHREIKISTNNSIN